MRYKFGDLIEEVSERNTQLEYGLEDTIGVTIEKGLIPTVANLSQTALDKFYVVRHNTFIYNPRTHGVRIGMGYNKTDRVYITSWNNVAFRVKDTAKDIVNPDYLWLYFCQSEWDRETNYYALGSSTIVFLWSLFLDIEIEIPEKEVQDSIVDKYRILHNRIELKKKINDNLSSQRDALFQEMYPDEKSLPIGWSLRPLEQLASLITDYVANGSFQSLADNVQYLENNTGNVLIRLTDYNNNFNGNFVYISDSAYKFLSKSMLYGGEIIIANVGVNVGTTFRCPNLDYRMSLGPNSIMIRDERLQEYLYAYFVSVKGQHALQEIVTGSAQPKFNKTGLRSMKIAVPDDHGILDNLNKTLSLIYKMQCMNDDEIRKLYCLRDILLQELSR